MQGVVVSQVYNSARPPLSPPLVNVYTHRVEIGDFYILLYIYSIYTVDCYRSFHLLRRDLIAVVPPPSHNPLSPV